MCVLSTDIGVVCPLLVSGVAFSPVVVNIISAGVEVQEIFFLIHGIWLTLPWDTI